MFKTFRNKATFNGVCDLVYNLSPPDGHFDEKRLIMINYVGQELKGLKDESFKEHTLIHLFGQILSRALFSSSKRLIVENFFPYINIVYV